MANDKNSTGAEGTRTLFEFLHPNHDKVIVGREGTIESTVPATGMDRLRRMFSLDEYGAQSKEVVVITQTVFMTTLGGGIFGGVVRSRNALINFLETNQATKFQDHLQAKRELQRVMSVAFGKGAFQWGLRVGFFCTSFASLLTMVSVYRGKESVLEYLIAGGVTGALFKMNLGLKGAVAGGVAGAALGGIGGAASLLVLKLGGTSMDEIRSFAKHMKDTRDDAIRKKSQSATTSDNSHVDLQIVGDDLQYKNLEVDNENK